MKWFDKLIKKNENSEGVSLWKFLIFLSIGVILLVFANTYITESDNKGNIESSKNSSVSTLSQNESYEEKLEKRIKSLFSQIDGVGKVDVLITLESTEEIIINKDEPLKETDSQEQDSNGGTRKTLDKDQESKTVLVNTANGGTEPIILKKYMPMVKGILILAEGGDNPIVKQNLTKAATILLDVSAHKIQVCKMK